MWDHAERAWTAKEETLTVKVNSNRRKIEAGKQREQRLTETIDQCGQQLQQQTEETTETKVQLAAAKETVRQGTCSVQLYEFTAGFPSSVGAWLEKRQQDNVNKKAEAARAAARLAKERAEAARVVAAKKAEEAKSCWVVRALRFCWRGLLSILGSFICVILLVLAICVGATLILLGLVAAENARYWKVRGGLFTYAWWLFLDCGRAPLRVIWLVAFFLRWLCACIGNWSWDPWTDEGKRLPKKVGDTLSTGAYAWRGVYKTRREYDYYTGEGYDVVVDAYWIFDGVPAWSA